MSVATDGSGGSPVGGSIEALRQLKQIESDWERRLAAARQDGEKVLSAARAEVEEAIHRARLAAEKAREATLQSARESAEAEAARILDEGRSAAKAIGQKTSKELEPLREKLIETVLGEFRPKGSK